MAVINNLSASVVSFSVNGSNTNFKNSEGTYNTTTILNGGETFSDETLNLLSFKFKVNGLLNHTIKSIIVNSLLLDDKGELHNTTNFKQTLNGVLVSGNISGNTSTKTISSTTFILNEEVKDSNYEITLELLNNNNSSCYYGLESIIINLSDINYKIHISFNGPKINRTASSIVVGAILLNLLAVDVSFSKDPTSNFDKEKDNIEGRMYLKKDGIYVDGYQYGVNALATGLKAGLVTIANTLNKDENGGIIAPLDGDCVPTMQVVYEILDSISNGIVALPEATLEIKGTVILSKSSFDLDEDGGILAPTEENVAATPLLVYNVLATAKNYTDTLLEGVQAPINIEEAIYNEETEEEEIIELSLLQGFTFSQDFERDANNKIYMAWLEIV